MSSRIDDTTPLFCSIETAKAIGDHVEYGIKVQRGYGGEDSWHILRRYSDFVTLDSDLKPSAASPSLPPKKVFGNTSREFIAERQQRLQAYLDEVLQHHLLANSLPVKRFLHDDLYQSNFQEMALQHISMFIRSEPDWQVVEPLSDIGTRFQKGYFLAKNLKMPKEKFMLSWCPFGPYAYIDEKERTALIKQHSTLQHAYLQPIILSSASKAGAIFIRPYNDKGSLQDYFAKAKVKTNYLKKYGQPKSVCPLNIGEIRGIGRQVLDFMKYMQDKNYPLGHIHSGNILVETGKIRITDIENHVLGVPSKYRSFVVQHRKLKTMEAIDCYNFGHLLYEMICGRPLGAASLTTIPPECPQGLDSLLMQLLNSESLKGGILTLDDVRLLPVFNDITPQPIDKPVIKIPSKLKECIQAAKTQFEAALTDEQKMYYQIKKRSVLKAHHMSDEERRKRRQKKASTSRDFSDDSGRNTPTTMFNGRNSSTENPASSPSAPPPPPPPAAPASPPAAAPPPPPPANLPAAVSTPDKSRGALLGSISGFSKGKLKRTVTVDKSAPKV